MAVKVEVKSDSTNGKPKKDENESKPLDYILNAVRKEKGDAVAVKGSKIPDVERIPTDIFEFDLGIGGGFPRGRMSIVYGVESSGKTNLVLKAMAHVQKFFPPPCNRCVFVNLENTFDPVWAAKLGVDTDRLDVVNPAYGEEAVDIVDALLRASDLAVMAVDSIAVLIASKEIEKSVETADVGTSAMLIKRMCNKAVIALASESRKGHFPALILVNQRRFKPGVLFGDPETMPGGETMKFVSSLTVRLYGKNVVNKDIHPDLPAWKDTSVIVKKSKIPVAAVNFTYKMAMIETGDLKIGETDSWDTVSSHLKAMGVLVKDGASWTIFGEGYKNLVSVQERYVVDDSFKQRCHKTVYEAVAEKTFVVPEKEEEAPKQD